MEGRGKITDKSHLVCIVCKSGPLEKLHYVSHLLGKRHQKNLKNRSKALRKDEASRTLHVTGFNQNTPAETLAGIFFKYMVLNVMPFPKYAFVELKTRECVKECLGDAHYIGDQRLKVSLRHKAQETTESTPIKLSWRVKNILSVKSPSEKSQWNNIHMLINEIELKVRDYEQRELLRQNMENFLRPHFPMATAHVFGSSANNLGFMGCDVDLYVFLGVDPWDVGTKAQKESKARDLTWYLARKLKTFNHGYKVQAIARARVPIVKFVDAVTKLQVDLSFRNGMPVYNTQLICQYTRTHLLVRPYLMVIRYWAKIQDVAGGGQPTYLITNYGLTMLMLFYLMVRGPPIIPSVAHLKTQCPMDIRGEHRINGWDCSFGQNVQDWASRRHNTNILELVSEFFEYYGSFDTKQWVISPLAGHLLDKNAVKDRNLQKLPPCMRFYCGQETDLQLDTALCLQDPFEHCYNVTRGLQAGPLTEFQYKCRKAAEITQDIANGHRQFGDLFEEIFIDEDVLKEIQVSADSPTPKEVDITQEEIITLDDSDDVSQDDISQDEIEVLDGNSDEKTNSGASSSTSTKSFSNAGKQNVKEEEEEEDFLVIDKTEDEIQINDDSVEEILPDETTNDSSVEEIPNGDVAIEILRENGVSNAHSNCDSTAKVPETVPDNKLFKFPLDFSTAKEFTITFDGSISGGKELMTNGDDIGQAACSLVHFILQQCFKMEVSPVESVSDGGKRKSESPESIEPGKRIKNVEGESVRIILKHQKVAQYKCTAETELWIGRKKVSKTMPTKQNHNPLQYEMAVTEAQMAIGLDKEVSACKGKGKLEFTVTIWQDKESPTNILITGDSLSDERLTKSMMMPMFIFLSSFIPNLLEKVSLYIVTTSSKR